jgi:hypothetical protein
MDTYCSTCGEPWDVYHLQHDEVFETDLTEAEVEYWQALPPAQQLGKRYRELFRALGWEFGKTVVNVTRCPACPKDAKPDPDKVAAKAALEDLLGDDLDALAATFEDHHL